MIIALYGLAFAFSYYVVEQTWGKLKLDTHNIPVTSHLPRKISIRPYGI